MTTNQVQLQGFDLGIGDAFVGELAETGVDTVDDFTLGQQLVNDFSGRLDLEVRYARQARARAARGNWPNLFKRQRSS